MSNADKLSKMGLHNLPKQSVRIMVSETTAMSFPYLVSSFVLNHCETSNNTGTHGLFTCQTIKLCADFLGVDVEVHYSNHSIVQIVDMCIGLGIKVISRSTTQWMYSEEELLAMKKFKEFGGIFVNAGGNDDAKLTNEPTNVPKDYAVSIGSVNDPDYSGTDITGYAGWELPPNPKSPQPIYTHTSAFTPVIAFVASIVQSAYGFNLDQFKQWLMDNSIVSDVDPTERILKIGVQNMKRVIELEIGGVAKVDGKVTAIDVPAMIVSKRTMVPLRFIAEAFPNCEVSFEVDPLTKAVTKVIVTQEI